MHPPAISTPPPVRFLAPDRERHVGPLADSIPGLHLARGAFTREAQAWLLDAIRHEGLVETPHLLPAISVASRAPREAPVARRSTAADREQAFY